MKFEIGDRVRRKKNGQVGVVVHVLPTLPHARIYQVRWDGVEQISQHWIGHLEAIPALIQLAEAAE